jgi:hypothetical protein
METPQVVPIGYAGLIEEDPAIKAEKLLARKDEFEKELASLINRHSLENGSDTPDFILARFLRQALDAFDLLHEGSKVGDVLPAQKFVVPMNQALVEAVTRREAWYAPSTI